MISYSSYFSWDRPRILQVYGLFGAALKARGARKLLEAPTSHLDDLGAPIFWETARKIYHKRLVVWPCYFFTGSVGLMGMRPT